jgi:hypothetical protein
MTRELNREQVKYISNRLVQTLTDILENADEHIQFENILEALIDIFTFEMSFVCANCRKKIVHQLKRCVPHMLTEANQAAAMRPDEHTCH